MKTIKWTKLVERESDFWKNYMMISSIGDVKEAFGFAIKERLTTRRDMTFIHWLNPKASWDCSLQIEEKLKKNPRFIEKVNKIFNKSRKELMNVNQHLEKIDFGKLTDKKLLGLYKQFCKVYRGLYTAFHMSVYTDSIEHKAKNWLLRKLEKIKSDEKFDDYFIKLTTWPKLDLLQEEELALITMAMNARRRNIKRENLDKLIAKHTAKFAGLPVISDEIKPWDEKHFQNRLDELLSKPRNKLINIFDKLHSYPNRIKRDQETLINTLSIPPLVQKFFKLIGLLTWIRLVSRNTFALAHYSSRNLFSEIGRRNNLTAEDIKWLTPDETENLILTSRLPSTKKLNDRKFASVLLFRNGKYKIIEGKQADQFIRKEVGETISFAKSDLIKGAIAYPGLAQGKAKLILSPKDIVKMQKGDILVARMTTADIVPAVRLAAAIVTDEGGITCHAAIVSRELKIPCVIGTKFATKMLKDNNIIIVDADKGIVKKVSTKYD